MLSMKFTLHYNNAHVQSHAHAMFLWQPELLGLRNQARLREHSDDRKYGGKKHSYQNKLFKFGSHFQIKYGSGSVPCSIFTGLFGFGYEFWDP